MLVFLVFASYLSDAINHCLGLRLIRAIFMSHRDSGCFEEKSTKTLFVFASLNSIRLVASMWKSLLKCNDRG